MKNPFKYFEMKKMDLVLIIFLLILSFSPNIYYARADMKNISKEKYLEIKVDGVVKHKIKLTGNKGEKDIRIEKDEHLNVVHIENDVVIMKEANCKDKLCVKSKPITHNGETIVCLPNKVVLMIIGGDYTDEDANSF